MEHVEVFFEQIKGFFTLETKLDCKGCQNVFRQARVWVLIVAERKADCCKIVTLLKNSLNDKSTQNSLSAAWKEVSRPTT